MDLQETTDGKKYTQNDLVKIGCNDCEGCHACCEGMGDSIVLDPLDMHRLTFNLHQTFDEMLAGRIELRIVDGVILPNLKMEETTDRCTFLNEEGRCSIHSFRPGICRLFPLGRLYEGDSFTYINQIHECPKENKTKFKIRKWLDTPNLNRYEAYIGQWHTFLKKVQQRMQTVTDGAEQKEISLYLLNSFYRIPYHADGDFYQEFEDRMDTAYGKLML